MCILMNVLECTNALINEISEDNNIDHGIFIIACFMGLYMCTDNQPFVKNIQMVYIEKIIRVYMNKENNIEVRASLLADLIKFQSYIIDIFFKQFNHN